MEKIKTTKKFTKFLVIILILLATVVVVATVSHYYDGEYSSVRILFIISYFSCLLCAILSKKIKFVIMYLLIAMLIPQIELACITEFYSNVREILIDRNNPGFFSAFGSFSETFFSLALPIFIGILKIPYLLLGRNQ